MTANEKVLSKLKKIKAHADKSEELGNKAEAEVFAAKMKQMLDQYKLSMSDLEFEDHLDEEIIRKWVVWDAHGYKSTRKRSSWIELLCGVVAKAHGCRMFVRTGSNGPVIVGHTSNVELAEHTLVILVKSADKISTEEYNAYYNDVYREDGHGGRAKGYRMSWLVGFVDAMRLKFQEQEGSDAGTALVRVKTELTKVNSYVDNMQGTRRVQGTNAANTSRAGYNDGNKYGKNMNMNMKGNKPATKHIR